MLDMLNKSIGGKLTIRVSCVLFIIFFSIASMNVIHGNKTFFVHEKESSQKLASAMMTGISASMLAGEQEAVQKRLEEFGRISGVEELELIEREGVISRSKSGNEVNKKIEALKTKENVDNLENGLKGKAYADFETQEGNHKRFFTIINPVYNEKACFTCHSQENKILGVLRIVQDQGSAGQENLIWNILLSLIGLLLIAGSIFVLLKKAFYQPVNDLINGTMPLSSGDLTLRFNLKSKDELGRLSDAFNKIVDSMHSIVSQVRHSADRLASSAEQMSSSTQEMNATTQEVSGMVQKVSKGATTQAETLQETFETLEKTAVSIKQIVEDAQEANRVVGDTNAQAEASKVQAQGTVKKIEKLSNTINDTSKAIRVLGDMSQQIGEITITITSIADQTNLLALNAAIEAARAGEAGRGFAVVAEEVRKLAEGSAEAVRKIGGLIRSIQNETNHVVSAIEVSSKEVQDGAIEVTKITRVLSEICQGAQNSYRLTNGISESGQQQLKELERGVKAVNEVADIAKEAASSVQDAFTSTEEQTASMQQMSASAQELAHLAMDLKEIVSKFKLDEQKSSG